MKVIVQQEIDKCQNCPFIEYGGTSFSEDVYYCKKTGKDVGSGRTIPNHCPLIEETMEILRKK